MIFVVRHDASGDRLLTFEGMDEKATSDMFSKDGVSFDFLTQQDFELRKAAIPPMVIPPSGPSLEDRVSALELKVSKIPTPVGP